MPAQNLGCLLGKTAKFTEKIAESRSKLPANEKISELLPLQESCLREIC
jgi:hypothetical protein